jgi:hypothetical protein
VWILQDIRTRARHTCTPHAHATRALLKHPLLTVSDPLRTARGSIPLCQRTMLTGASSGSAFAGSVQDPRSVAHARFTHARFTHTHTHAMHARTHLPHAMQTRHSPLLTRRPPPDGPRLDRQRVRWCRTEARATQANARSCDTISRCSSCYSLKQLARTSRVRFPIGASAGAGGGAGGAAEKGWSVRNTRI